MIDGLGLEKLCLTSDISRPNVIHQFGLLLHAENDHKINVNSTNNLWEGKWKMKVSYRPTSFFTDK